MKQRTAYNQQDLDEAANRIRSLGGHLPVVVTVTEGKRTRTSAQNARYWSSLTELLEQISEAIREVAEHTGYTDLEVRQIVAADMPAEQVAILYCRKPEAAHEVMKMICNIPTSTRLGTKAFTKFEARLEQTMSEIIGNITAITRAAL